MQNDVADNKMGQNTNTGYNPSKCWQSLNNLEYYLQRIWDEIHTSMWTNLDLQNHWFSEARLIDIFPIYLEYGRIGALHSNTELWCLSVLLSEAEVE